VLIARLEVFVVGRRMEENGGEWRRMEENGGVR
jgi:peptidoglycan/xylan/chitin deacetylase (PgdA/CDA1 family)